MELLDQYDVFQLACKQRKMWGILFFPWLEDDFVTFNKSIENLLEAIPWFDEKDDNFYQILGDEFGVALFETEEEMASKYNQVVSDDYPEGDLPHIYCLTCSPEGILLNENT